MSESQRLRDNGRSTVFEKLPPELRRAIDVAIVERTPPTFQAIWMNLKLADHGVTYSAFYRYARRIRDQANLAETAWLSEEEGPDLEEVIHKLVARRLLDMLINAHGAPTAEIVALMSALRQAARTALHSRKLSEETRIAWARLQRDQRELRLECDRLQMTRGRLEGGTPSAKRPRKSDPHPLAGLEESPPPRSASPSNGRAPLAIASDSSTDP